MIKIRQILKSLTRKAFIPISALTMFAASFGYGQDYILQGTIRTLNTTSTGSPINNAKVDVDSGTYIAKTDINGNYSITGIPSGQHSIRFSMPGKLGFIENYTLNSNSTFNVSLPDTTQSVSIGTETLKTTDIKEMIGGNIYEDDNPSFWPSDTVNITPVFFSNANSYDTTGYKNAIGSLTSDWHDAPAGSKEFVKQRKMFLPNTDSVYTRTHNGWIIKFNSDDNTTAVLDNSQNIPYVKLAITRVTVNDKATMQHEEGRSEDYNTVTSRASNMNLNAIIPMNLIDYLIDNFKDDFKFAMMRGEENVHLLNIEDYIIPTTPNVPTPSQPVDNSVNELRDNTLKWSNIFGTDEYHIQVGTDAGFNDLVLDDSLVMTTSEVLTNLPANTDLYWRLKSKNTAAQGDWSSTFKFTTGSVLPVELTSFRGYANKDNVSLNWITATEMNSYGFDIERKVDASWIKVGFVEGHGTSNVKNEYRFQYIDEKFGIEKFRLKQIDRDGKFEYSKELEIQTSSPVENIVAQNYPNPFNPETTIAFTIPYAAFVTIKVFNPLGEQVATLESQRFAAGMYTTQWNASRFASGLYFYRVQADGLVQTCKLLLLR